MPKAKTIKWKGKKYGLLKWGGRKATIDVLKQRKHEAKERKKMLKGMEKGKGKAPIVGPIYFYGSDIYDKVFARHQDIGNKMLNNMLNKIGAKDLKGKTVLEISAGTGRYTLPLARKGANVVAVDLSRTQLLELRKKLMKNPKLKKNVEIIKDDMRTFQTDKRADFMLCNLGFMQSRENTIKAFKNIGRAMKDNAKGVIVEILPFSPRGKKTFSRQKEIYKAMGLEVEETGIRCRYKNRKDHIKRLQIMGKKGGPLSRWGRARSKEEAEAIEDLQDAVTDAYKLGEDSYLPVYTVTFTKQDIKKLDKLA